MKYKIIKVGGTYYIQRKKRFLFWEYWATLGTHSACRCGSGPREFYTVAEAKAKIERMERHKLEKANLKEEWKNPIVIEETNNNNSI